MARFLRPPKLLNPRRRGKIGKGALWGLAAVALIACGVGYAAVQGKLLDLFQGETSRTDLVTVPVKRGELWITVVESGNLDSASNVTLSSQVKGSTKIISIVPEGTKAYKGMVLVELDSSAFRDAADQQKIGLKQAESLRDQSRKALEIQRTQNLSDIAAAELQAKLARLDLVKYEKGEYELLKTELAAKITIAKEDLAQKLDKYAFSKRQAKKGYVNQNVLEQDRIGVTKAELDLKSAELQSTVLEKYDKDRALAEKRANAIEFERELARTKLKAEAAIEQAKADLGARVLTADVEKTKYEKLLDQIKLCTIIAPQEGQVVYANGSHRRSQERIIEAGASVDQRQAIIKLPDLSRMQVDTRIHESKIGLVKPGMRAIVKVKAESDRDYEGVVESLASIPNSPSWRQPDLREYTAVIHIRETAGTQILKPGLTAEVEIISEVLESVLKIPVQSTVARNEKFFVFIDRAGKQEIRQIALGASNDIETEVKQITGKDLDPGQKFAVNIKEGDRVVLAPRTSLPELYAQLEDAEPETQAVPPKKQGSGQSSHHSGQSSHHKGTKSPKHGERPTPAHSKKAKPINRVSESFKNFDKNSDGVLTKTEIAGHRIATAFATIDTNRDGTVDRSEFEVAAAACAKSQGGGGPQ